MGSREDYEQKEDMRKEQVLCKDLSCGWGTLTLIPLFIGV